jgi:probable O-glycosylation ligase (exosortase A-associated)
MNAGTVLIYLVTAAGCVAGIVRPFYGLLVYVAFAILRPSVESGLWHGSVYPDHFSRYVGVCVLVGWALRRFGRWRLDHATVTVLVLMGYWFWCAVSSLQSIDPWRGWDFVFFLAKVFLPFLVGVSVIDTVGKVKALAWVIILCQGHVAAELNWDYYHGYYRALEEGYGVMDNNCVAIAMVTCFGLAFFMGLGRGRWWGRVVALLAAALIGNVILFSFSRGGILALFVTGGVTFFLLPRRWPNYLIFAAAVAAGVCLMDADMWSRFLTSFGGETGLEASAASRLVLWRNCLSLAVRHPLFGIGPDQFGLYAPQFGWELGKEGHSLWLQNLAEVGVPGLCMLAGFFGLTVVRLWPLMRERTAVSDPWLHDAARMVIAALAGFIVSSQFVTIKYLEQPYYVALVGICVIKLCQAAPPAHTQVACGHEKAKEGP